MADEIKSKIGFDTLDAINDIIRLNKTLDQYNATMQKIAKGTGNFNAEQVKAGNIIAKLADQNQLTAATLTKLANSYSNAQKEATKFAAAQAQISKSGFVDPRTQQQPLAKFVSDALANKAATEARANAQAQKEQAAAMQIAATAANAEADSLRKLAAANSLVASQAGKIAASKGQSQTPFQQNIGQSNAPSFGAALGGAELEKNQQRLKATEAALRAVNKEGLAAGNAVKKGAEVGAGGARSLELSWRSVIRVFGTQFAAGGVRSLVSIFTEGIRDAREFEIRLAEIQTLSKDFQNSGINTVGKVVSDLSAQFGRPVQDVAGALYETLSNQIGNAAESTRFLADSLEFSVASVTSATDSVNLLSGVLNSYGLTAASTTRISDELFRTIDLGRVTGSELANTLGRLLPIMSALGVSTTETFASLAELSIQGVRANDAMTQITNVALKLIRPTEALNTRFEQLGITAPEVGVALFGFQGFLEKITETTGKTSDEIGDLFNQIRGIRGVIGLVSVDTQRFDATLKAITKSAGASKAAFDIINQTNGQQLTKELESARAFLVNDFGRPAIAVFNEVIESIGGARVAVSLLGTALVGLVGTALLVFLAQGIQSFRIFGAAARAAGINVNFASLNVKGFNASVALIGVGSALAIEEVFTRIGDSASIAAEKTQSLQEANNTIAKVDVEAARSGNEARKEAVAQDAKLILESLRQRQLLYDKDKKASFDLQSQVTDNFKEQLAERESAIGQFIDKIRSKSADAEKDIKTVENAFADRISGVQSERFDRNLKGMDEQSQAVALLNRSKDLGGQAQELFTKGDEASLQRGNQLLDQAFGAASRLADMTKFRQFGERQINALLEQQFKEMANITTQKLKEKKAADTLLVTNKGAANDARKDITKLNDLQVELQNQLKAGVSPDATQIKGIETEIKATGQRLETTLSKFVTKGLTEDLSLVALQKQIGETVTSAITGKQVKLSFAADESVNAVLAKLTETSAKTPPEITVAIKTLTGKDFNAVEGFGGLSTAVAKQAKDLQTGIENELNLNFLKKDFDTALGGVNNSVDAIKQTFNEIGDASKFKQKFGLGASGPGQSGQNLKAIEDSRTAGLSAIEQIRQQAIAAIQAQDPVAIKSIQDRLAAFIKGTQGGLGNTQGLNLVIPGLQNVGGVDGAKPLQDAAVQLGAAINTAAEAQAKLNLEQSKATTNSNQVELLKSLGALGGQQGPALTALGGSLQTIGTGATSAATGLTAVDPAARVAQSSLLNIQTTINGFSTVTIVDQAQLAVDALNRLRDAQGAGAAAAAGAGGKVQGKMHGGFVQYLAGGGFAKGTDTVAAMLTPKEFVVNARDSQRFASELTAMNSGRMPVSMGGQSEGSVSVGNISVSVKGGDTSERTINEIANGLNRAIRQGKIKLRG